MNGWTEDGLTKAWKALARQSSQEDWRFVRLTDLGAVTIEAGCHFPLGREALIVSFPVTTSINISKLPEGKGFDVTCITGQSVFNGRTAIAIVRRPEGLPDIFAIIAVDLIRTLEVGLESNKKDINQLFLERLKEWQDFMSRRHKPLSSDAQVGLYGELCLLKALSGTSLGASAIDCWLGPLRAAHDFHIFAGSIEVKSTTSKSSFNARINSIEQLDSERLPLYLCAYRFEECTDGTSLSDLISQLREYFEQAGSKRKFEALLMVMGYLDEHSHLYCRLLSLKDEMAFRVEDNMPRLIRSNLPPAIRSATYVLNLDALEISFFGVSQMLNDFGLN
jgi:hypothetical protein